MKLSLLRRVGFAALLGLGATAAQAQSANRLALVIGEANYASAPLPTAANDASLVSQTLSADGFDVSEFHDLDRVGLQANIEAFVTKVRAAPPGSAVTVYLAGIGASADCDDLLLPVDAHIASSADVAKVGFSMTKLMRELAGTKSAVRLVMLDGARPVPAEVSAVPLPRGLLPLRAPEATTFGLSAEIHDFEATPKAGDTNDAYAAAFVAAAAQPFTDLETLMRSIRLSTHQSTDGAQTPWQETNPTQPSFSFPLTVDPAQAQAVAATLPNSSSPIGKLPAADAYTAAIWRNSISDYQAYLDAFKNSAPNELLARVKTLIDELKTVDPACQAAAAPPPPPPHRVVVGPICPDGFVPEDGYNGAYCQPIRRPPVLLCPPGFVRIAGLDDYACAPVAPPPVLECPQGFRAFGDLDRLRAVGLTPYCQPDVPPPFVCPPQMHRRFHNGGLFCTYDGPPPPLCPPGLHPIWDRDAADYICLQNPGAPPISCPIDGRAQWMFDHWICVGDFHRDGPICPPGAAAIWQDGRVVCGALPPPPSLCPPGYFQLSNGGTCVPALLPALLPAAAAAIIIGNHHDHPVANCPPGQPIVNGQCLPRPMPIGATPPPPLPGKAPPPPAPQPTPQPTRGPVGATPSPTLVLPTPPVKTPGLATPAPAPAPLPSLLPRPPSPPVATPVLPPSPIATSPAPAPAPAPTLLPRPPSPPVTPPSPASAPTVLPKFPSPPVAPQPACALGQIRVNGACEPMPKANATPPLPSPPVTPPTPPKAGALLPPVAPNVAPSVTAQPPKLVAPVAPPPPKLVAPSPPPPPPPPKLIGPAPAVAPAVAPTAPPPPPPPPKLVAPSPPPPPPPKLVAPVVAPPAPAPKATVAPDAAKGKLCGKPGLPDCPK